MSIFKKMTNDIALSNYFESLDSEIINVVERKDNVYIGISSKANYEVLLNSVKLLNGHSSRIDEYDDFPYQDFIEFNLLNKIDNKMVNVKLAFDLDGNNKITSNSFLEILNSNGVIKKSNELNKEEINQISINHSLISENKNNKIDYNSENVNKIKPK